MTKSKLVECQFLIPLHRDVEISDGLPHDFDAWLWLEEELFLRFDGWTQAPGEYLGAWKSAQTERKAGTLPEGTQSL